MTASARKVRNSLASDGKLGVLSLVVVDTIFHVSSEVTNQTLNWPGSGVTQSANRVTFDLVREFLEHVDLSKVSVAEFHPFEHIDHPAGAFSAGSALAATLVLVELGEAKNGVNYIGLVVHDDDGCCAETALSVLQVIEVHQSFVTLFLGQHGDGRTAGNNGLQVVPAANYTLAVSFNQLTQRNGHLLLNGDRIVDVATDAEQFHAGVSFSAEAVEPVGASSHDGWANSDCFDIGHGRWASVKASIGGEWRL